MKLLPGVTASGVALAIALLLCAAIESPALWLITWIVCILWSVTVLVTALFISISRGVNRVEEGVRRNLEL